jgi:hypothetical protein
LGFRVALSNSNIISGTAGLQQRDEKKGVEFFYIPAQRRELSFPFALRRSSSFQNQKAIAQGCCCARPDKGGKYRVSHTAQGEREREGDCKIKRFGRRGRQGEGDRDGGGSSSSGDEEQLVSLSLPSPDNDVLRLLRLGYSISR